MAFTSDLLVQKTAVGQRISVKEQGKGVINSNQLACHNHFPL